MFNLEMVQIGKPKNIMIKNVINITKWGKTKVGKCAFLVEWENSVEIIEAESLPYSAPTQRLPRQLTLNLWLFSILLTGRHLTHRISDANLTHQCLLSSCYHFLSQLSCPFSLAKIKEIDVIEGNKKLKAYLIFIIKIYFENIYNT